MSKLRSTQKLFGADVLDLRYSGRMKRSSKKSLIIFVAKISVVFSNIIQSFQIPATFIGKNNLCSRTCVSAAMNAAQRQETAKAKKTLNCTLLSKKLDLLNIYVGSAPILRT